MSLEEIKKNNEILYKMLEASGDIGFVWDIDAGQVEWIGNIHKTLQEQDLEKEINFSYINQHINPQDLPKRLQHVHALVSSKKDYECDYRIRTPKGKTIWVREIGFVEYNTDMDKPLYYGIIRDITRDKEEVQDLKAIAYIDLGVNMPNLEGFSQLMEDEIAHAHNTGQSGTFFCVGIDRLCAIEEAYDSKITEEVFKQVAARLDDLAGKNARIGVLSGDSFGVLIPKLDIEHRRYRAYEIIKAFSNTPLSTSEGDVRVTVSVGSIEYPRDNFSAHSLVQRARAALDNARQFGQSAYYAYDYSNEKRDCFKHWVITSDDFINAMEENRVNLAFQEVIDTSSGKTLFYEALIRMIDQTGEVIPAGMFMPAVEKMGLCRFADALALRKAVEELSYYKDISLSINVSALSLMSEEWMAIVTELLSDNKDVASRLIVEITETVAMHDIERVSEIIDELHELGCRVALDDFGAGQTSFSQLNILDIDLIKVDADFVQSMFDKAENKAFLKAMHLLADSFDLPLIVEGVETMEIAEVLQQEGLSNFQGFAYSMPSIERLWLPEDHKDRHFIKEEIAVNRA